MIAKLLALVEPRLLLSASIGGLIVGLSVLTVMLGICGGQIAELEYENGKFRVTTIASYQRIVGELVAERNGARQVALNTAEAVGGRR